MCQSEREVPRKTLKLWRTQSPRRFYGGDWNQNGSCVFDGLLEDHEVLLQKLGSWFDPRFGGVNKEARLVNSAIQEALIGTDIQLLNLTYGGRIACTGACLGAPDTWVDILAAQILHYSSSDRVLLHKCCVETPRVLASRVNLKMKRGGSTGSRDYSAVHL